MHTIANEIDSINAGRPEHFGSLTIFPLFRNTPVAPEPGYLLLEEAIAQGSARITELTTGASVPELRFENLGAKPVLLLDGEELIGAKQNRTVNLTILAPAKQVIVVPVSCVEAGRWRMESKEHFAPAPHVMYAAARAARSEQVTASMAAGGTRRSDQSAVWQEIAAKSERLRAPSPTQAMSDIYETHAGSIDAYLRAFSWSSGQCGAVFAIGGRILGMDLLDHPDTMRKLFPKLLRSYALDAIETARSAPAAEDAARDFLGRAAKSALSSQPAVGLGKDLRLTGIDVSGAALWAEERCVHLCAFASNGSGGTAAMQTRINRSFTRRTR